MSKLTVSAGGYGYGYDMEVSMVIGVPDKLLSQMWSNYSNQWNIKTLLKRKMTPLSVRTAITIMWREKVSESKEIVLKYSCTNTEVV